MRFVSPLKRGRLVQRYKRFLADIVLDDGEALTAACPNTGAMLGLADPGLTVWLSASAKPSRKYAHTWEMVETNRASKPCLVGINAGHPNEIVSEAVRAARIPELAGYARLDREVRYGAASRIDILLSDALRGLAYVEIKNVHFMRRRGLAEFPDCVTERGRKHLDELAMVARSGHRAVMLFVVQRGDATRLGMAADIDPAYAAALDRARGAGVEVLAYRCRLTPGEIVLDKALPIEPDAIRVTTPRRRS